MGRVAVFGSVTMEFTYTVSQWPEPKKSMDALTLERKLGGKGLYQAFACRRLGAQTTLITSVGKDSYGKEVEAELAHEFITPCIEYQDFDPRQGVCTDITTVVECGDDNFVVARRDATDKLTLAFIEEQGRNAVVQSDALLVTFDVSLEAVYKLIEFARAAGKPVIVNASPTSDARLDLLKGVKPSYLIATSKEARDWLHRMKARTPEKLEAFSVEDIAAFLVENVPGRVILTLSAEEGGGCIVIDGDNKLAVRTYSGYPVVTPKAIGARSMFCAGVAVAVAEDPKSDESRILALAAAARSRAESHYLSLPFRNPAVEDVIRHNPPLTVTTTSRKAPRTITTG